METDCLVFENTETGITAIILRPKQSLDNAVKAVQRLCPDLSPSRIQALVRTNCPTIIEMNERLGVDQVIPRVEAAPDAGVIAPAPAKANGTHRRPRAPRWARIAAVAAPAVVGGVALANLLQPSATPKTATAKAAPSVSQEDKAAASTYKDPDFKKIADGGQMKCDAMGAYEAKCVDQDGKVMTSEASVGTSTAFTFSYDYEKVGFRLFPDVDSAAAWSAEGANKDLYQNVKQHGRVVLWGTDAKRIKEWEEPFLAEERRAAKAKLDRVHKTAAYEVAPPEDAAPLPDRLAVLAFGTLGVTEESVQQAVYSDDAESFQLLQAVQLVLGNADLSQLGTIPSGVNDAVAVVLDADEQPKEPKGDPKTTTPSEPVVERVPAPTAPPSTTPASNPAPAVGQPNPPAPAPDPAADYRPAEPPETSKPPVTQPDQPVPPADPAPDNPAPTDPAPPVTEDPATEPGFDGEPETPPAPPAQEEPGFGGLPPAPPVLEEPGLDGLGLDGMPSAWAA
ncbi:hypothetical protein ACWGH2_41730 [Streptomyces sp. NPDC054871]